MSLDGLCDGDCGQPAVLEIEVGGESGYFCAACAPTGKARPIERSAWGLYSIPCGACKQEARYVGCDRNGDDLWHCDFCDFWQ
jgi:hypothetical protein